MCAWFCRFLLVRKLKCVHTYRLVSSVEILLRYASLWWNCEMEIFEWNFNKIFTIYLVLLFVFEVPLPNPFLFRTNRSLINKRLFSTRLSRFFRRIFLTFLLTIFCSNKGLKPNVRNRMLKLEIIRKVWWISTLSLTSTWF